MRNKFEKLAIISSLLLPGIVFADSSMGEMGASSSAGVEALDVMLMSLGIFFLITAVFLLITILTLTKGGFIEKSFRILSIGFFGVTLTEVDRLLHMHFGIDVIETIFNNEVVEAIFHHILTLITFGAFTIGFYKLSERLRAISQAAAPQAQAEKKPAETK